MEEKDIISIAIQNAIEWTKLQDNKKEIENGLHPLYKDAVEMAEHISYHAVKGVFPDELFKHRSPNETKAESDYIKSNYKQHTLPVFVDYRSTITRPLGDGNWNISYKEDATAFKESNKSFQSYVEYELPIYGSLENFIKFILPDIKSIDANGFISIRPKDIKLKQVNDEMVIDEDSLYEPTIFFHSSESVVNYKEQQFYLFLSKQKSNVKVNNQTKKEGNIFELYTKNNVYYIIQTDEKQKNKFDIELYYEHNLDECPVSQLMGIPNLKNDSILWQSPFLYSTDLLDIVAMNANWLQASINSCVFPVKVMYGQRCDFKDVNGFQCNDGKIINESGTEHVCNVCSGTGLKSRISPLGTLLLNPTTKFEVGEEKSTQAPLQYISPEIHTLEFISKKIEEDTQKARSILHLYTTNTQVKTQGDSTATGMAIDVKSMYAFIKPISDQMFMIYDFCLEMIGKQRYGESFEKPALTYPKTFDFKSSEDYLQDITNAMTANLPPSFIQTILLSYLNSYYGDNSQATVIFKLISETDRLFGMSQDEINMKMAKGTIAKWEDILHSSILLFINESIDEDANFLLKDLATQKEVLIDKAKEVEGEISGNSVNDLINQITP